MMRPRSRCFNRSLADERGQTTLEYALVAVFFIGLLILLHEGFRNYVVGWFAWIARRYASPGV